MVTMTTTLLPELPAETVARLRAKGWGPAKILSGMGYPGYGAKFAARVLDRVAVGNVSVAIAIDNELGR
jgi:hypothetical protein